MFDTKAMIQKLDEREKKISYLQDNLYKFDLDQIRRNMGYKPGGRGMLKHFVAKLFGFEKEIRDILTDNYNLRCHIAVLDGKIDKKSKVKGHSATEAEKKTKAKNPKIVKKIT